MEPGNRGEDHGVDRGTELGLEDRGTEERGTENRGTIPPCAH